MGKAKVWASGSWGQRVQSRGSGDLGLLRLEARTSLGHYRGLHNFFDRVLGCIVVSVIVRTVEPKATILVIIPSSI